MSEPADDRNTINIKESANYHDTLNSKTAMSKAKPPNFTITAWITTPLKLKSGVTDLLF